MATLVRGSRSPEILDKNWARLANLVNEKTDTGAYPAAATAKACRPIVEKLARGLADGYTQAPASLA